MNGVRKVIALLVIIFIGVPILIGVIWGVGLTRAVVSTEFLTEIPQDIIARVPDLLEETLEAVDREEAIRDEDSRAWVRALTHAETSPKELLEKIGIMSWLRNELSRSLEDIGKILRGEIAARPVILNMRPLKAALTHEGIEQYLMDIMEKLPPCTDDQVKVWVEEAVREKPFKYDTPPACQPPELATAVKLLRQAWINEVDEIPDEVDMIQFDEWDNYRYRGVNVTRLVVTLTYFLFFIPALILLLAAIIATSSGPRIIRWIGFPTLIGGLLAFGLSKLVGNIGQWWATDIGPTSYWYSDINHAPFAEVGEIFLAKTGDIIGIVFERLFSAVNTVAGTVCIVGIVLIALSYLISSSRDTHDTRDTRDTSGTGTGTGGNKTEPETTPPPPQLPGKENDKALKTPEPTEEK